MKSLLILGNGISRTDWKQVLFIKDWDNETWVCNHAYQEHINIDLVGTVHVWVAEKAYEYKIEHNLHYEIYCNELVEKYNEIKKMPYYHGWSTGNELIYQALKSDYDEIVLAGFDFGGKDIYQPMELPGLNFKNHFKLITDEFGMSKIKFLKDIL